MSTDPTGPMARWLVANAHKPFYSQWHLHFSRLASVVGGNEAAHKHLNAAGRDLAALGWPTRLALVDTLPPELPGSPTPPPPHWRTDWHV